MTNEEAKSIIEFFYHDILNTYKQRTDLQCALDLAIRSLEETDNHGNCVLTMFGECSYKETGCSDCKIKEKIREALKNERPKGKWHNLKENANDLPAKTAWYVCKVKNSHDLRLVFGYEDVTIDKFDAWFEVKEDYE